MKLFPARISLRNTKGQLKKWWMIHFQDSFHSTYNRILVGFFYILQGLVTRSCQYFYLMASCDGCHAWSRRRLLIPEHLVVLLVGPISHTSTQYMDFVEIVNILLDLSTTCSSHFSGSWAPFVYSCYSIPICCNLLSEVKLSTRSFCSITIVTLCANLFRCNKWNYQLNLALSSRDAWHFCVSLPTIYETASSLHQDLPLL